MVTCSCLTAPIDGVGPWPPNGDLVASLNGDPHGWGNPAIRAGDAIPAVFAQVQVLNVVLPTPLMTRLAAAKSPGSYYPGGD